jgi:hypothetical protein
LADIQTLARFALQSGDTAVMQRDLEMILTIVEMVLPPSDRKIPPFSDNLSCPFSRKELLSASAHYQLRRAPGIVFVW